jgi:hypothetical protein
LIGKIDRGTWLLPLIRHIGSEPIVRAAFAVGKNQPFRPPAVKDPKIAVVCDMWRRVLMRVGDFFDQGPSWEGKNANEMIREKAS